MEETQIVTVRHKSFYHVIPDADQSQYKAEVVRVWSFKHLPYTANAVIEVGRLLNQAGLYNTQGVGDPIAVEIARCKFIAQTVLKEWDRKTDDGEDLPVTPENIGTLPPSVLREFGRRMQRGDDISEQELASLKN